MPIVRVRLCFSLSRCDCGLTDRLLFLSLQLCVYHHKGKYKNMYELKPEYRNEFPAPQSEMAEGGEDDDDGGEDMDES